MAEDPDVEQPLLPLLLAELEKRNLRFDDFPEPGKPLPWPDQRQLIEKAIAVGRLDCAAGMAAACGFRVTGGRLAWALKRWLMRQPA